MNLSPEARKLLALQQVKYFRSLPDKKARISRCWKSIQRNGWSAEQLNVLKFEVHNLSGSAGSYGLVVLGSVAQSLDRLLSVDENMSALSPRISELIADLVRAFDAAMD